MTVYLVALLSLAVVLLVVRYAMVYARLRGSRVVTCPETHTKAGVEVNVAKAAAAATIGTSSYRLSECSHWPERAGCGQACVSEIATAPFDCLVRTHLTKWYANQACAVCKQPVGQIDWFDRRPALLTPAGKTIAWPDVRAEEIDDILATHRPVCFDCHVAETFRRTHPELVLDNPYASLPPGR